MNGTGGLFQPRVLLVEDDAILAQAYLEFLRDEPCCVSHRSTVAAAIDAIQNEPPEVVLLDLLLPDSTGLDVLDFIERNALPISVIVMTSVSTLSTQVPQVPRIVIVMFS